ncbi:hypothetical protein Tco_1242288 [Tanacetum coccineum]
MPRTIETHDDEAGSSRSKRFRQYDTMEEAMLPCVHLVPWPIYSSCIVYWKVLNNMGCAEEIENMLEIKVLTLLEFARRLDLYHSDEVNEEGSDVYFQGGLCSDENFNARGYWLRISRADELHLSRSLASTIRSPILRVKHQNGYTNVAWLMAKWLKRKGVGSQKDSMICYGQLITKIAKKMRELIDSEGRLIPEDPALGVPRVAIPKGPRPSMQDLYDRMGSMEIRQEAIERMAYRQSYH